METGDEISDKRSIEIASEIKKMNPGDFSTLLSVVTTGVTSLMSSTKSMITASAIAAMATEKMTYKQKNC